MNKKFQHLLEKRSSRFIGYCRVSTDEQAAFGVSLDAQKAQIQAASIAHGYECIGFESDTASGGLNPGRRPGLASALAIIASGVADGIVVTKLDRLSRSTIDTLQLIQDFEKKGWGIVSIAEHLDTTTAMGLFSVSVFAAAAQMERGLIRERTRAAMDQVARERRGRSRWLRFGFRLEGCPEAFEMQKGHRGKLVEHPGEQRLLKRIIRLHSQGLGAHAIATRLNARGGMNPRTERPWSVGGVRAILTTALKSGATAGRSKRAFLEGKQRGEERETGGTDV